jgi:hypothetical protein
MTLPDRSEDYVHRVGRVGRAEAQGLAISLVGAAKEKVWYYDKKKWGGKTLSTKPADQGGCCIWYDEPSLMRGIEKRLAAGGYTGNVVSLMACDLPSDVFGQPPRSPSWTPSVLGRTRAADVPPPPPPVPP